MSHEMFEVLGTDCPGPVLVQHPEGHPDHVRVVDGVHLVRHHVAELGELNHPRPVSVILVKDHNHESGQ